MPVINVTFSFEAVMVAPTQLVKVTVTCFFLPEPVCATK